MSGDSIVVRKCKGIDEFRACVDLQREVWNFSDLELVPLRLFVVADKVGGQVIGAFEGKDMVGFTLSVPGYRSGFPYLHSHMAGVRAAYRNYGLGRRMKLFQRDDALARGMDLVEWTFDPLEIKNAYFNIERLGAIARRYTINQYGITTSPLQGFLPTDRLIAEWWLKSKRVESLLSSGKLPARSEIVKTISIPAEIYDWKAQAETRDKAAEVQQRNQAEFLQAFADGLSVVAYERDAAGNGKFLLAHWDENWSYAAK